MDGGLRVPCPCPAACPAPPSRPSRRPSLCVSVCLCLGAPCVRPLPHPPAVLPVSACPLNSSALHHLRSPSLLSISISISPSSLPSDHMIRRFCYRLVSPPLPSQALLHPQRRLSPSACVMEIPLCFASVWEASPALCHVNRCTSALVPLPNDLAHQP